MSVVVVPIQCADNVVEAMAHDTPVVVYCLACLRSKKFDPYLIAAKLGALPFGMIVGVLPCNGCGEKLTAVFPWYAPSPREWAKIARPLAEQKPPEDGVRIEGSRFAYRIDMWKKNHSDIVRTLALLDNLNMGRAAFDAALIQYPNDDLTMRRGAQLSGDSLRPDVKPVEKEK